MDIMICSWHGKECKDGINCSWHKRYTICPTHGDRSACPIECTYCHFHGSRSNCPISCGVADIYLCRG